MLFVIVKNSAGEKIGEFQADNNTNLVDMAEEYGVDIPYSCHAGACMTCLCDVEKGKENIDPEGEGEVFIDIEENQILACITTGLEEKIKDKEKHEVILLAKSL
jgi:ferredoxin